MMRRLLALMMLNSGPRSFTFVGSCSSITSSLDFSSLSSGSIASGDFGVYIDCAQSGSAPAAVTPSDFTNGINTGGVTIRSMVSAKKLTGSEGVITGMDGTTGDRKIGLVFRPSKPFTSFNMLDMASEITASNPASQTCDPSGETSAAIVVGVAADVGGGSGAFSTFSPAADGTVATSNGDMVAGHKTFNTSPASVAIDMADLGANWLASLYFTFVD